MSLRRPFRDSWEQREYKRPARSASTPAEKPSWTTIRRVSPSPERSEQVLKPAGPESRELAEYLSPTVEDESDSDDDYPERLALTPTPEPAPTPEPELREEQAGSNERSTTVERLFGQPLTPDAPPFPVDDTLKEGLSPFDISSSAATVASGTPRASDTSIPASRPISDPSTIWPEDSASNVASVSSASALVTDDFSSDFSTTPASTNPPLLRSTSDIERALLQSPDFPVHLLRPVPDLVTLLTQIAPVIGDPGSGPVRFGQPSTSPTNSIFAAWAVAKEQNWYGPYDPLKDSILKEKPIDVSGNSNLPWKRDIKPFDIDSYVPSRDRSSGRSTLSNSSSTRSSAYSSGSSTNTSMNTTNPPRTWKGRQYSVNPALKTRHLSIDLLERQISHGELLSLNLSIDARRDAILIGGAPNDIGGSLLSDTGRGVSRHGLPIDATSSLTGHSRISTPSTIRTSSSSSRTHVSARNSSMSVASGSSGHTRSSSANKRAAERGYDEYDQKEGRYRAGGAGSSTAFETGRYGTGGVMLWRLVRVSAGVEGEEHVAWWCVPERSLGGFF